MTGAVAAIVAAIDARGAGRRPSTRPGSIARSRTAMATPASASWPRIEELSHPYRPARGFGVASRAPAGVPGSQSSAAACDVAQHLPDFIASIERQTIGFERDRGHRRR